MRDINFRAEEVFNFLLMYKKKNVALRKIMINYDFSYSDPYDNVDRAPRPRLQCR